MSLSSRKNIVVIGGGTGSFTLLSALKDKPVNITALVNMADDGGSTGQLRDELGVLPPGDIRQCLVALSNVPQMRDLFNYRFDEGRLKGHAFGNLFLTALEKTTGNFAEGVEVASRVLNITGHVEPTTLTSVTLCTKDKKGNVIKGEYAISDSVFQGRPEVWLEPDPVAHPAAVAAIEKADMVVIAPGNPYRSLAPALIVPGISKALRASTAKKVYVCNLVTKPGQTDDFAVHDFADEIERFVGASFLDYVLYNMQQPSSDLLEKYAREGEFGVKVDEARLKTAAYEAIGQNLLAGTIWQNDNKNDPLAHERTLIRHDAAAVAGMLLELSERD
jgi:uncharacterized cofD-like protein